MTFLTEAEKKNMAIWQYSVTDKSVTTRLFTPLWEFWARLVPESVAPNVLTAAALLCQVQAFYTCWLYGRQFPRAVSFIAMCLIVLYQTLDAIDGKHARNTRNSSPLGELFDHSCDHVGSVFMILAMCFCLGITSIPILWYVVQISQLLFLQSHVAALETRKLEFGLFSGPGEMLFIFEAILLAQFALPFPIMGIVDTYGIQLVTLLVSSTGLSPEQQVVWVAHFTDPLTICRYVYVMVLVYALVKALLVKTPTYWMRLGLVLCYVLRALPLILVHVSPIGSEYTLRDVVLDGLFMSVLTTDVVVCKMASRELHPFVVLFAMISLINPLAIVGIVCFYYVALLVEVSEYLHFPIFSVSRNVYVDGVYDLCHVGHKKQFENALAMGTRLVVGVVSDENVFKYKNKYPVMTTQERVTEVTALRMVSEVIPDCPCPAPFEWRQSEGLPPTAPILDEAFIKKYRIHVVAHGEEYLPEKMAPGTMDYYAIPRAMGICRALPRTPGISTSELMQRMKDRVTEKDRLDAHKATSKPDATPETKQTATETTPDKATTTTTPEQTTSTTAKTTTPEKTLEPEQATTASDKPTTEKEKEKDKQGGEEEEEEAEPVPQASRRKSSVSSVPTRKQPPRSTKKAPRAD